MTTEEHEMWDTLNIEYENAYRENPLKRSCISHAITLLKPGSLVLDIGCGTGVPVAQMLAEAGMHVTGTDVAPNMVSIARQRVPKGNFVVADMVEYEPEGSFDAVFVIYSHLGLSYHASHSTVSRLVKALRQNGLLVIGQSIADSVAMDDPAWDATHTYVEGYNLPFWGAPFATLMFTRAGQKKWLDSMGLEVVYDEVGIFKPGDAKCDPEEQQYVIARRGEKAGVRVAKPLPVR